ncbi:flagellar type III secretion system protein FlhB [Jhaorihella thermophila]|uniref:Flagellar biosynthetic protein FlhB n=1 Tax=Jhaorihella thermophila TaxID=488547 RepID=A0A1H5XRW0_9RHOB|nr:flagellar type III secretion system protein FlhB [Jhaorihella thermophila]SEG14150.1 flagellar biosynthetic protein FlhB [Jhaorihella thermophila]
MSESDDRSQDKPHEPTPQKLRKAREKGDIPLSADLSLAAGYFGFFLVATALGGHVVSQLGSPLGALLDRPDRLSEQVFDGGARAVSGQLLMALSAPLGLIFAIPAIAALLSIVAQRGLVFSGSRLQPKLARISIISNAGKKFGRAGLFEFFKSLIKLIVYAAVLGWLLHGRLHDIVATVHMPAPAAAVELARLSVQLLGMIVVVAFAIAAVDTVWQHLEYRRRHRMTHKELMDEFKEMEGDPHVKQERRQRGHEIATSRMMADVPTADVVIVNPTHYAVALKWDRAPGSAPVCVAKGVDEVAASIRAAAEEAGVPIHSDPPTARALHATVDLGQEIAEEHYRAVAAAIRFADRMRKIAREQSAWR